MARKRSKKSRKTRRSSDDGYGWMKGDRYMTPVRPLDEWSGGKRRK